MIDPFNRYRFQRASTTPAPQAENTTPATDDKNQSRWRFWAPPSGKPPLHPGTTSGALQRASCQAPAPRLSPTPPPEMPAAAVAIGRNAPTPGVHQGQVLATAMHGGVREFRELLAQAPKNEILAVLKHNQWEIFKVAAAYGHLNIMHECASLAPDHLGNMMRSDHYAACREAAIGGHENVLAWLFHPGNPAFKTFGRTQELQEKLTMLRASGKASVWGLRQCGMDAAADSMQGIEQALLEDLKR